ncbi:hypothetical protein Ga0074115_11275 [endosymbiont of Ridgeia piscesae]|jgi:hypothetical protein|uniref:Uncharacterized protein n=1 Tax=endosymbiont of Ridgeia piscesae TaxID=54398 RepID=A0A0T5YWU5_9GAMM|nr:hypothetical protein Ga0074115_11275 [endosymbiont of Ridgeia piscesae]KRT58020.1 hypothetical protein Ga0076813_127013 [endosymbiont of Ridgeia piscesae]
MQALISKNIYDYYDARPLGKRLLAYAVPNLINVTWNPNIGDGSGFRLVVFDV